MDSHNTNNIHQAELLRVKAEESAGVQQGTGERKVVAIYPRQGRGLTIYEEDLHCLAPGRYLDDQVVNFVLRLQNLTANGELRDPQIRVCDSHFYTQATRGVAGVSDTAQLEANVGRLKRWYRSGGPFDVPCTMVPVCEDFHWYLMVVIRTGTETSTICVLDSFGHGVRGASAELLAQVVTRMQSPVPEIAVQHVRALQQPNATDCGLYLLHNAQAVAAVIGRGGEISVTELEGALQTGEPASRGELVSLIHRVGTIGDEELPALIPHEEVQDSVTLAAGSSVEVDGHVTITNSKDNEWALSIDEVCELLRLCQGAARDLEISGKHRYIFMRMVGRSLLRFRILRVSGQWRVTR